MNTANRLGRAMLNGDSGEIARLTGLKSYDVNRLFPPESYKYFANRKQLVRCEPRHIIDVLVGRQRFIVGSSYRATAIRGRIEGLRRTWFFGGIELSR